VISLFVRFTRGGSEGIVSMARVGVWALVMVTMASCSVTGKVRSAFGGALPIEVKVDPNVNEDNPVAVDVVVVYNDKLVDALLKKPASEWFDERKKKQFLADHPGELLVEHREWVPGQTVDPFKIAYQSGAHRVIVFAHYQTEGEHRQALQAPQSFRLLLGERDFQVEVTQ
jgi:type VI secretion system protein